MDQHGVLVENESTLKVHTTMIHIRDARAKEEYIQSLLFRFDFLAHLIHNADQAHVGLDKFLFASRIKHLALGRNAVPGILGTANEVRTGFAGVLCELLESDFSSAAGGSYEEGDEARREGGRDERIGRSDD